MLYMNQFKGHLKINNISGNMCTWHVSGWQYNNSWFGGLSAPCFCFMKHNQRIPLHYRLQSAYMPIKLWIKYPTYCGIIITVHYHKLLTGTLQCRIKSQEMFAEWLKASNKNIKYFNFKYISFLLIIKDYVVTGCNSSYFII